MKKIRAMVAVAGVLIFYSQAATAQQRTLQFNINYNYSMPVGSFKSDLINNNSPRGFMGGLMYSFSDKLSAGLAFGYQDYYQKYPRAVYALSKTQDVSAVLTNSIQTSPLLLKAVYFPFEGAFLKPYISVGAGANVVDFNQYLGQFGNSQTNTEFLAQGGLGVKIPFSRFNSSGFNIGADYNYAPYKMNGYNDLNSVNLYAGITIDLR